MEITDEPPNPSNWLTSTVWKSAAIVASLWAIVVVALNWKAIVSKSEHQDEFARAVSVTVDLSGDDISRSAATLPRKRLHLHMILPLFSPEGNYRVTITRIKGLDNVQMQVSSSAQRSWAQNRPDG
jgi:hypothetical protein